MLFPEMCALDSLADALQLDLSYDENAGSMLVRVSV